VLSAIFARWRSAYQLRRNELHRQVMALQHWSLQVHTRAFRAWQAYVQERNAKQIRYQQARAARSDKLRTSGVETWLQVCIQHMLQVCHDLNLCIINLWFRRRIKFVRSDCKSLS
jgi:hypothetical protein